MSDPFQRIIDDALLKYPEPVDRNLHDLMEEQKAIWETYKQVLLESNMCREHLDTLRKKVTLLTESIS